MSRITIALRCLGVAGLFVVSLGQAEAPAPRHVVSSDLGWLEGHWCGNQGKDTIEEWWVLRGETLLGFATTTREGHLLSFEYARISDRGRQGITFVAQPSGLPPTNFALDKLDGQSVSFFNAAHDFPQRISYHRDGTGLHAQIAGPGKDGDQQTAYDYQACR